MDDEKIAAILLVSLKSPMLYINIPIQITFSGPETLKQETPKPEVPKKRGGRSVFNEKETAYLREIQKGNLRPCMKIKKEIAEELNRDVRQIANWFQNNDPRRGIRRKTY
jgi:truncated hemoglobin YjbI